MPDPLRFLVAESELPEDREKRRRSAGQSSGESYVETLCSLVPDATCDQVKPAEEDSPRQDAAGIARYDAVFLCGSPLHVYERTPEVERQLDFMREVFRSGTPAFGSCAGLQVATVAAGGTVRSNAHGHEAGFARRIAPTEAGRTHPLLAGRPAAYDAPAIHGDEVEQLPEGATLLAGNAVTAIQAAEIRFDGGVFWGVQYHPELSLREIAQALRRQAETLMEDGLARTPDDVEAQARLIEALHREPERRDLAWRLGLDRQVTEARTRQTELRNFIDRLVRPTRRERRGSGA
ncbi:type 1 glutamine amidotransferase [Roseomonas elaeocarpi]|uniref:Type 1 glutamine amidotransferase n=1 Tax=Roseomonas elaeocarpi TaxID=907779 RepID=A0ABV6JRI3_9PROT